MDNFNIDIPGFENFTCKAVNVPKISSNDNSYTIIIYYKLNYKWQKYLPKFLYKFFGIKKTIYKNCFLSSMTQKDEPCNTQVVLDFKTGIDTCCK